MAKFIYYRDNSALVIKKLIKKDSRYLQTAKKTLKAEAGRVKDDIQVMISGRDHPRKALRILNKKNIGYAPRMRPPHRAPIIHIQSGDLLRSFLKRPLRYFSSKDGIGYRIGFDEKMRTKGGVPGGGVGIITIRRLLDYLITGTEKMIPRDFLTPVIKKTTKRYWNFMSEAMKAATEARE